MKIGEDRIKFKQPPREKLALGMAPLVDIVFLLICFYLFVMRSIQTQADMQVELPVVEHVMAEHVRPTELTVNLRPDGVIVLNEREVAAGELGQVLRASVERARERGEKVSLVIRADHRQRYEELDAILAAARSADLREVVLRARERP